MLNLHFLACRLQLHTGTGNAIISVSVFMTRGAPRYFTAAISFHFLPSLFLVRFAFFLFARRDISTNIVAVKARRNWLGSDGKSI